MSNPDLKRWVEKLRQQEMPALGSVIAEINGIIESDRADAGQLAEVILRDPTFTAHVLRAVNSVTYNYSGQAISTVSKAIVLIGMRGVSAICVCILILERLVQGRPHDRVLRLMARSFHAATQARAAFVAAHPDSEADKAEEVFVAGLLYHLGEMAFWITIGEPEDTDLLSTDSKQRKRALEATLGGSFDELTLELSEHWKLGETLTAALSGDKQRDPRVSSVLLGERISRAALAGWESPQFKKVLSEYARHCNLNRDDAFASMKSSAAKAVDISASYGLGQVSSMIPKPGLEDKNRGDKNNEYVSTRTRDKKRKKPLAQTSSNQFTPQPLVQLNILRELSNAAAEHYDVNTMLQMVLEGMHRGVGLERVALSFIVRGSMKTKYALGEGTESWRRQLSFPLNTDQDTIFSYAVKQDRTTWLDCAFIDDNPRLYSDEIVAVIGCRPALFRAVRIGERKAALFYADRGKHQAAIDQEHVRSFTHFADQAELYLNRLSRRKTA